MSTLSELTETFPRLVPTARALSVWSDFREENFVPKVTEFNEVFVGNTLVVKQPLGDSRQRSAAAMFEALLVCTLREAPTPPPVAIPLDVESSAYYEPGYASFTRVPGTVLSHERVRKLSDDEKREYGKRIGSFAAWMADVVSLDAYSEIFNDSHEQKDVPKIYDRANAIRPTAFYARRGYFMDALNQTLIELRDELCEREIDGSLEPAIVCHDDPRPENTTFQRQHGNWVLHGMFDFGLTKPSRPERELRHLAMMGKVALEAGISSYESATDTTLDPDLIQFWALAQAATVCAYQFLEGNMRIVRSRLRDLATLLPDREWYVN